MRHDADILSAETPITGEALFAPLAEFYRDDDLTLPTFDILPGGEVPEPYRSLLVHSNDMTPTLERHFHRLIGLRVLGRHHDEAGDTLARQVVLVGEKDDALVEFGAIRIHLDVFEAEPRRLIVDGAAPLGAILRDYAVEHTSRPDAYFRVTPDELICRAMRLDAASAPILYGRCNRLSTTAGRLIAQVVEVLPPIET